MGCLRIFKNHDPSVEQPIKILNGSWSSLFIVGEGEMTDESKEVAEIEFSVGAVPKQDWKLGDLKIYNDLRAGKPDYTRTAGTPATWSFHSLLPFYFDGAPNAFNASGKPEDQEYLIWKPIDCDTGSIRIYGVPTELPENYTILVERYNPAGSGRQPVDATIKNVVKILAIGDNDASRMHIWRDKVHMNDAIFGDLKKFTENISRIESGSLTATLMNLAPSETINETINQLVRYAIEHQTSVTSTVYMFGVEFDQKRIISSAQRLETIQRARIQQKIIDEPEMARILFPEATPREIRKELTKMEVR